MSFMRTLFGAIGTASATTAWDNASRVSRSEIVPTLNDPGAAMARLQAGGLTSEQARAALDRLVDAQASTVGATHTFTLAFVIFLLAAIAVWFAPKAKRGVEMGAAH